MKKEKGIVSAGHPITAEAGKIILEKGGNAYDAVAGAFFAACLAEPSLASLGGGSYITVKNNDGKKMVYDCFVQTPGQKKDEKEMDFYPVEVDFGGATQVFHIGMASSAVPGSTKGVFEMQAEMGVLPIKEVIAPAVKFAREGIKMNWFSGFAFEILSEIYKSRKETLRLFESQKKKKELLQEGEILKNPQLAEVLEFLAENGVEEFYQGEIAKKMVEDMEKCGGLISMDDMRSYEIKKRKPISVKYRGAEFITNPPPSAGGILISLSLKLLENFDLNSKKYGSFEHLMSLILVMKKVGEIRKNKIDKEIENNKNIVEEVLSPEFLKKALVDISDKVNKWGSTTQISVIDGDGNIASMTTTNGEGSGYLIPGTGSVLNNMLGEEDLNPKGFFQWKENQRISSMMAPSIIVKDGIQVALGSAGSNRLRSAILQTAVNILDFEKNMNDAVNGPRLHFENGKLDMEPGFSEKIIAMIRKEFANVNVWDDKNLFFGGANCVLFDKEKGEFSGAGDIRREGECLKAE